MDGRKPMLFSLFIDSLFFLFFPISFLHLRRFISPFHPFLMINQSFLIFLHLFNPLMDLGFTFRIPTDIFCLLTFLCFFTFPAVSQSSVDGPAMGKLKESLKNIEGLGWSGSDPCEWNHVQCDSVKRVVRIQIGERHLEGFLPAELNNLTALQRFEVMRNNLTGPLPSLTGLSSLQILLLSGNNFTSIPPDFFSGMSSLESVDLSYNSFSEWVIPKSLCDATYLQNFSATNSNVVGKIPEFFGDGTFLEMVELHLAFNGLEGEIPGSFSNSQIQSLWLNGDHPSSKLNGSIRVLQNMTNLREVWLHGNHFSGPIPELSGLTELWNLNLRDNDFTGVVPQSLVNLPSLRMLNLTNNFLQGPVPKFDTSKVKLDLMLTERNSFCLDVPNAVCDIRVNVLLSVVESMDYPLVFAENWKGNDPCTGWTGITCVGGNVTVINFQKMSLTGSISSNFSMLTSLKILILSNNMLTGTIPTELTTLPNLRELDVRNNQLHGEVPSFTNNVIVKTDGNPYMGNGSVSVPPPAGKVNITVPPPPVKGNVSVPQSDTSAIDKKSSNGKLIWGAAAGCLTAAIVLGVLGVCVCVCVCRRKTKLSSKVPSHTTLVVHPNHSGDDDAVKLKNAGFGVNWESCEFYSHTSSGLSDMRLVDSGNMLISYQVLRNVTNNFSEENILGKGGFGTVYKGELHDGTKIAVKRMESGVMSEKGLTEFKSEISVLTKVRHRHLVALLGHCLDGNERLLVYEYMPRGTLSSHLFNWKEEGLKSLEWKRRLTIALDVARGVEYLHGLAHQSFIHRDLKPSNILLGDDMRAKVADFGLVRLAPDGKGSIETRLAGTFGYLAPEYAATGRVTKKVDMFSFGVILMELITGRKALDETRPEESLYLVTWFRKMQSNKDTFDNAIDPTIDLDEETLASINTVAELAGHCCAREPHQRPEMSHAVNVLSPLVEVWKPAELDSEDNYKIDLDMTLPQALKKWQASENNSSIDECSSSIPTSSDNTQTSIPTRPSGFADSFTSADGR